METRTASFRGRRDSGFRTGSVRTIAAGAPVYFSGQRTTCHRDSKQWPRGQEHSLYAAKSKHRSVYLPLVRGIVPGALEVFDFAEQGMVTGKRTNTTVAPQALFMLNDAFIRAYAFELADKLQAQQSGELERHVAKAYRLILNRQPTADETTRARCIFE